MFPQNINISVNFVNGVVVVQSLSHVWLFVTPMTETHQASLSFTCLPELLRFISIESVMLSNYLILCQPLLLLPSISPSIRVFSNESTLCNPMNCSMSGFPVLHYLPKSAQTHVHWVDDAIQQSHPLSPASPPALNLYWHQGLSQWVSSLNQVAKSIGALASASILPMNIQGWFPLRLTSLISLLSKEWTLKGLI